MTPPNFADLFARAAGLRPYDYQRILGEAERLPAVLEVPTGSGKTHAILCSWLYQRRALGTAPRRLVYALPMRTLVEQTVGVARSIRNSLGLTDDELGIQILMGGEDASEWMRHPSRDTILIATIDMALSRALGRGYGESRFIWPVSFGLLNTDSRWVFDEVQLMGPARATSAQLEGLRLALGGNGCETMWVSATVDPSALETVDHPRLGDRLGLSADDRSGPLAGRLNARKVLERVDLAEGPRAQYASRVAAALLERHARGTRTLCVLNRVATALEVHDALRRAEPDASLALVHSRFRPADREAAMVRALAEVNPAGPGSIVVATQVVEAGVDVSSALLATETAPFSSVVQRIGRCNRAGEHVEARVLWLDAGEPTPAGAAPYSEADLRAAREALAGLVGQSLSPAFLADHPPVHEERRPTAVLRRRDLVDLFDTTPDLSGLDVDVAPFIRDDDDRAVSACFRAIADPAQREISGDEQPAPLRAELVQVPIGLVSGSRERGEAGTSPPAWVLDHVDGVWVRRDPAPGATVLLDARDGRYRAELGWTGRPADIPQALPGATSGPEGVGSDWGSYRRTWVTLDDHLRAVTEQAESLAAALELTEAEAAALRTAAAVHDVGKAHPVFQDTLLRSLGEDGAAERERRAGTIWAKSGGLHRAAHARRAFRHELASALALADDGSGRRDADGPLVRYLVAAHHGRVRLSIRPAPDEPRPAGAAAGARFALGIVEGDTLPRIQTPAGDVGPVELGLSCMELGGEPFSWTHEAVALRDRLGPLRLAYLEGLVRIADWLGSEEHDA